MPVRRHLPVESSNVKAVGYDPQEKVVSACGPKREAAPPMTDPDIAFVIPAGAVLRNSAGDTFRTDRAINVKVGAKDVSFTATCMDTGHTARLVATIGSNGTETERARHQRLRSKPPLEKR